MQQHIHSGGWKGSNYSIMACIIFCWLFSTRISPQSIFKPVLGMWITTSEFPENFPNFSQSFKGVVDRGVLFPSRLMFIHCLITLVYPSILLYQIQPISRFFSTQTEPEQKVHILNSSFIIHALYSFQIN